MVLVPTKGRVIFLVILGSSIAIGVGALARREEPASPTIEETTLPVGSGGSSGPPASGASTGSHPPYLEAFTPVTLPCLSLRILVPGPTLIFPPVLVDVNSVEG